MSRSVSRDLVAIVSVLVATVVRSWLDPVLGERSPYITYIVAILVSSWYGGLRPGLIAMVLGFLTAFYLFASPRGSFWVSGVDAQVATISYVVTGLVSLGLTEMMHAAEQRARAVTRELEVKQAALEQEIIERKTAQVECVILFRRIVSAQEQERQRISRELHDQCGQELTAMGLELKVLSDAIENGRDVAPRLDSLKRLLERISEDIHHLSLKLRPSVLDDIGLAVAVSNYLESWQKLTGVAVDYECSGWGETRIAEDVETALYRVLQEALTNVARHASAPVVSVVLSRSSSAIDLIIEDRGQGFDMANVRESGARLGLLGMRERMTAIGGSLEVESTKGEGTTVFARVPSAT